MNRARSVHHGLLVAALLGGALLSAYGLAWVLRGIYGLAGTWRSLVLTGALGLSALLGLAAAADRVRAWRRGSWTSVALAPFRAGVYLAVSGSAVYLFALQPFKALFLVLTYGVVAGVFALVVLLLHREPAPLPPRAARRLEGACLALTVLFVGGELGLRLASRFSSSPLLARGNVSVREQIRLNRFEPHRRVLGFECTERGYHDVEPAPPGERSGKLVVSIGDSFSTGVVPHWFHYTTVAERELAGVEIYNVGINSTGPAEYLVMLREDALPAAPDAILIAVFVGNDVTEAQRFDPSYALARWWFDRDNLLLYQLPVRLARVAAEKRGDAEVVREGQADWRNDPLFEQEGRDLERRFPWLIDPRLEIASFTEDAFLRIEAVRADRICDPEERDAYGPFFAALDALRAAAGDVPLLVMLIPDEFQVEDELWQAVLAHPFAQPDLDRDLPQHEIGAWLARRGVPCLDLLPILRARPRLPDGKYHLYKLRDTHWNRWGNEVAGRALAEFLREQLR